MSPLLLPLPTKTSSLSCEAFSVSTKFDQSLVEGKQISSMMLNQRRVAMKEIIEADTVPMKEVLCPGATFAPTQQIMLSNLGQGGRP